MREQFNGFSPTDISTDERAAWAALAGLFIDRELGPDELFEIARALIAAECSVDDPWHLLQTIVAPAFLANLTQVACCWSGWSMEEVEQIVMTFLARDRWRRMFMIRRARRLRKLYEADWQNIARELTCQPMNILKN